MPGSIAWFPQCWGEVVEFQEPISGLRFPTSHSLVPALPVRWVTGPHAGCLYMELPKLRAHSDLPHFRDPHILTTVPGVGWMGAGWHLWALPRDIIGTRAGGGINLRMSVHSDTCAVGPWGV